MGQEQDIQSIALILASLKASQEPGSKAAAQVAKMEEILGVGVNGNRFEHTEMVKVKWAFLRFNVPVTFWWELNTGRKGFRVGF